MWNTRVANTTFKAEKCRKYNKNKGLEGFKLGSPAFSIQVKTQPRSRFGEPVLMRDVRYGYLRVLAVLRVGTTLRVFKPAKRSAIALIQ